MDDNRMSILDLNNDCLLEIMKYIIADCELRDEPAYRKYNDIENFAEIHENIKDLLRIHFKETYYHRELTQAVKSYGLTIDFAKLQSTIANDKEGDAYWKLYTKAIRENKSLNNITLRFDATSSSPYPDFPKHFQMVKSTLESKKVTHLTISLNGYTLDDLNNFQNIESLTLDVQMSAEALATICKSNPRLYALGFMSTKLQGRLSDIIPHCSNLQFLTFVPKPDVDVAEYAPLAQLPKLDHITIGGAFKNGSQLAIFEAIQKWQSPERFLRISFSDELPVLSKVPIITTNSLESLELAMEETGIYLRASYYLFKVFKDGPLEPPLATITLIEANFQINWPWRRLILHACPASEIHELISLLKRFNLKGLTIDIIEDINGEETSIPKLFQSMLPVESFALESIYINYTELYPYDTIELVKIKSLRLLMCSFDDWESIELLSELPNLQTLDITVEKKFAKTSAKSLCNLLDTCQVNAFIRCNDWRIDFKKSDKIAGKSDGTNTLKIFDVYKRASLNELCEALANRNFNPKDMLDISYLNDIHFKDIAKVTEIQTLNKLKIRLSDTNGIEKLSDLTQLEDLTIFHTGEGSLIKLFDQLAMKESPSLQCLQLKVKNFTNEEVFMVSRIRSLTKLDLYGLAPEDCAPFNALLSSNIEELTLGVSNFPQPKLFAEFAENITTRLRHLKIEYHALVDLMEFKELSKLKELRSLDTCSVDSKNLPLFRELKHLENLFVSTFRIGDCKLTLPSLRKLVIYFSIGLKECQCLAELELLESLTLSSDYADGLRALADMKNLKELIIQRTSGSISEVYQAFASKVGLKLNHLSAPIRCFEELNEITRIKSLRKLHLTFITEVIISTDLGQLTELESLHMEYREYGNIDSLLAILESCKNLDRCTIERRFSSGENFVRKVHTHLKSIRDPALQGPLFLTVLYDTMYDTMVEYFDDAYLRVNYSFNNLV